MINVRILRAFAIFDKIRIEDLRDKELVPNMMTRRRLSRNAKMLNLLSYELGVKNGRIVYGSNYGELKESINILENIFSSQNPSPTDFQNSVYNAPSAYLSILQGNMNEILCVSNGNDTDESAFRAAAIKSLDGDEIFVALCESFDIESLRDLNVCEAACESAVGFVIKQTHEKASRNYGDFPLEPNFAPSIARAMSLYNFWRENKSAVIGVSC